MQIGSRQYETATLRVCIPTGLPPHMHQGVLELTHINVPVEDQRKGYGTKLLAQVCEEADEQSKILFLSALSSGGLSTTQLSMWYMKFGFKVIQPGKPVLMARQPRIAMRTVTDAVRKRAGRYHLANAINRALH